ncbi:hypothetical protein KXV78_000778 [Aspergillus fumigatus]|nr:hypothetical protein KXX44_003580 [Aspergillus fumigatus]KAH1859618.1 hypothetical protein KXX55_003101 [Aspergillus fumigatus]KAH3050611.1 hypothetical protein KXW01_005394 [Aspergillus fumigatus]KAH3463525.1 hypothetical protein KXV78_000778 [Aspergillus fumigatus]OXN23934.1 hypothetical protein CDV57_07874 [Aspergillus fumigatus]
MESDRKARKVVTGRPKQLGLPQVVKAKRSAEPLVVVRAKESPFDTFQQLFSCELAGTVVFVQRRTRPYKTKAIRRHPPEIRNKILCIFQRIDHENVMCAEECYVNDGIVFAVVDNLPLTLQHLVQHCTLYPTEGQLGSIIAQILSGITYLATVDFEHRSLICKNILLGKDGTVKIAALENCISRSTSQSHLPSIKALGDLMMYLMKKSAGKDGILGVDNVERWPLDSAAVDFLTLISSSSSLRSLTQVW